MLFLKLTFLAVLLPGYSNGDGFQGPTSFYLIQISSFANSTWAKNQGSGWLDDLQIHGWDSNSSTAIFLKPWSKGNFSDQEVTVLVDIFRVYLTGFTQEVRDMFNQFQLEYPFEIQCRAGCELHPGEAPGSFLSGALGGVEYLSVRNHSCVPTPAGGWRAEKLCTLIKKPEAWLSSGFSPGPDRLLLVCHVSGFYPKPVWVMWMRGDQEEPATQRGDILPNADGTWYLRVTLDVPTGEAAGLSCQVKHSSLGSQAIVLYWEPPISIGLICLAVIVPVLLLLIGLALRFRKRWSYSDIL